MTMGNSFYRDSLLGRLERHSMECPELTVCTYLRDECERETLTFGGLVSRVRTIAIRLAEELRPGDRALLLYPQGLEFLCAFLACLAAGVIAVPSYPPRGRRNSNQLNGVFVDCSPAAILTLASAPFVFTSARSALHYDKRYHDDEITYVIARCRPGVRPEDLAEAIRREVPNIEALTSDEFAWRSVTYWLLETGMGITVILTALLGMLVSSLVGSQTLYGVTNDHLSNYATLLAVGFSRAQLLTCVVVQAALLSALAAALGSAAFVAASRITERTPIPLEMVWQMYLVVLGLSFLTSLFGALLSLKTVWSIDPVTVFR